MINKNDRAKNALAFVNLLTPGNFDEAANWLSVNCEYKYQDTILTSSAIIKSFSDNHQNAAKKLDSIQYLDGRIEKSNENEFHILVKDKVTANGAEYVYTDRLIITTSNDQVKHGSILRIEHAPVEGEREKLLNFFKANNFKWP